MDEVNLGFLKRRDPDAEQILGSSAHVTMYIMAVETQKWERRNVEGTLYVVKRRSHPRFQLVVLNKLSTENYVEAIESGFHAEVSLPYLIYTQGGGKVHGMWFYEGGDLSKIAGLLAKVAASLPKPSQPMPTASTTTAQANGQQDDGGFWDKRMLADPPTDKAAPPTAAAPAVPLPPTGETDAITNLFKNMQVKKEAPSPAPVLLPPASVVALPPSFFQPPHPQQLSQQPAPPGPPGGGGGPGALLHHKQLDHLRAVAALSPASSTDMGSFSTGQAPNMLSKLFGKPAVAAPPPGTPPAQPLILPQPQAPAPQPPAPQPAPPMVGGNALAALFSNAANKSAATSAAAAGAAATPSRPAARAHDERLRQALSRLVQREEVLTALAEELRAVGLLP